MCAMSVSLSVACANNHIHKLDKSTKHAKYVYTRIQCSCVTRALDNTLIYGKINDAK